MSEKPDIEKAYETKSREETLAAFEADRERLWLEGYVPVGERWSEPDREIPGLGSVWRLMTNRRFAEHPELVKDANRLPTDRFHRLEVRYAPIERAPKSRGGVVDVTVTNNGRCPTCDLPTMLMPRPPYERYCDRCKAEFPE